MQKFLNMKKLIVALALLPLAAMAQNSNQGVPFNGEIVDINGEPVKRARIYVTDANRYALTDRKGRFGLTDVKPTDTLHIKYSGELYTVPVNGLKSIRLPLADQTQYTAVGDDYLVSMGFDYVKTRERTTAGSFITGEELVRTGRDDLLDALQGLVPSLRISKGGFGEGAKANIRNSSSINGSTEALYVVDGVIVESLFGISTYMLTTSRYLKMLISMAFLAVTVQLWFIQNVEVINKKGKYILQKSQIHLGLFAHHILVPFGLEHKVYVHLMNARH